MAETDIITGQYVRISQTAASLGDRIVARIIDYVIVMAYSFVMIVLFNQFDRMITNYFGNTVLVFAITFILILPPTLYSLICETFFHGQTIGKRVRHIRVVSIDGSQPTIGQLTIRWMFLLVDVWMSAIGILPIAFSKRHQRFGDMAAGTMVIREDNYQHWHSALDEFYWLTPEYKPTYPQAKLLSDGQAQIIDRTLHGHDDYNYDQVARLAEKVQKFLGIKTKENNFAFLSKVLHDYQYYTLETV